MPGPTVVVTYKDRDGDEFPVRVAPGDSWAQRARDEAERLIAEGRWRPNGELVFDRSEEG